MADEDPGLIELGRVEGVDTAEELLDRLRAAAAAPGDLKVDASSVISLDTTTFQMLVSAIQGKLEEGASVSWVGTSSKFEKAAMLLGLTEALHL